MNNQTRQTLISLGDAFRQFSRNGRWGTCGGCPRDVQGNAYPEHCAHTERYDHQLKADGLARTWDLYYKSHQDLAKSEPEPVDDTSVFRQEFECSPEEERQMFTGELIARSVAPAWRDCPPATIAFSHTGVSWTKQEDGRWRANGGACFPTPDGDACLVRLPLPTEDQ